MAVTLDNIIDTLLLESGQYISDLSPTLLIKEKVELMIERELGLYSRYLPTKVITRMRLYNGKIFSIPEDGFIPTAISDIRTDRLIPNGYTVAMVPGSVHNYYWRYDKPILYLRYPDQEYIVHYIADHVYDKVNKTISTINIHDRFITMLVGRFLMTVGRSRRAFTVADIPITSDASEMISEGKELYETTLQEVRTNSAFNLAIVI